MPAIGWEWAAGLALWTVAVFRLGYGMGRLVRDGSSIVPIDITRASPAARAAIDDALGRGRKIEAIRVLRQDTSCGLAEAKATIEALPPRGRAR